MFPPKILHLRCDIVLFNDKVAGSQASVQNEF